MKSNVTGDCRAFTLVEFVIIFVIFSLLVAMAIPAFMKVRESSLVKAYQSGEKLDPDQMKIVREYFKRYKSRDDIRTAVQPQSDSPILIPYDQITEVTINGEKFYAWTKK